MIKKLLIFLFLTSIFALMVALILHFWIINLHWFVSLIISAYLSATGITFMIMFIDINIERKKRGKPNAN